MAANAYIRTAYKENAHTSNNAAILCYFLGDVRAYSALLTQFASQAFAIKVGVLMALTASRITNIKNVKTDLAQPAQIANLDTA